MSFYLNLAATGFVWLFATWFVCKYHTDNGELFNNPVTKRLYPVFMTCMVLLGAIFVYKVSHIGELT